MSDTATADELVRLQEWYASECNGDWEHQYGVRIQTLDNPGWSIDIDLWETSLADRAFAPISLERSDADWVRCTLDVTIFKARGGARNLREMLSIFLAWAQRE
jgi:hypothetical protein